ncbi:MAG: L28 family ribosomal protein [bacterium]|nr:L28 family ribosomal protein [bacterium]
MSGGCYHCGKGILFGRSHTHHRGVAGGRWKKRAPKTQRIFEPNLQKIEIIEGKGTVRVRLCTKCLKRVKKDLRDGVKPFISLVHLPKDIPPVVVTA